MRVYVCLPIAVSVCVHMNRFDVFLNMYLVSVESLLHICK